MKEIVPDFQLGQTVPGTNSAGELINEALIGRTHEFPITEEVAAALNMDVRTVGRTIKARAMRNTSGGALLPGKVGVTTTADGIAGLGRLTGGGTLNARQAYTIDPGIPAAGVADDDICYVIIEGPVLVNFAAATTIAAGAVIKAGAAGVHVAATLSTDHGRLMGTMIAAISSGTQGIADIKLEWN